jgi:predicted aspartyl protease
MQRWNRDTSPVRQFPQWPNEPDRTVPPASDGKTGFHGLAVRKLPPAGKGARVTLKPHACLWLLTLLCTPVAAQADCSVNGRATIALQVVGGSVIVVPVEVNGITATFILDTGAQRSLVTEPAVRRLGLVRDEWVGTTIQGIGGIDRRANVNPRNLSLGGVALVRHTLTHDTSLTVGILPQASAGDVTIDGALGRDFLSVFDLDLDLPNRRLTLFQVQGCSGRFLPWHNGYDALAVTYPVEAALVVPVTLDGAQLHAMLDTGASASLLAAPGMSRVGINAATLAGDPSSQVNGIGTRTVTMHRHTFHSLRIGDEVIERPLIWVAPIRLTPIVDMLLGADWLFDRHIWISYTTRQLFVATR